MSSIYTYDKEKNCAYCAHNSGEGEHIECVYGEKPCAHFSYDVFKRKPKRTPKLPQYDAKDFSL